MNNKKQTALKVAGGMSGIYENLSWLEYKIGTLSSFINSQTSGVNDAMHPVISKLDDIKNYDLPELKLEVEKLQKNIQGSSNYFYRN